MSECWADKVAGALRPHYAGRWDIWWVYNTHPKPYYTWHARPTGTPVATIHADSPERLVERIAAVERCNDQSW